MYTYTHTYARIEEDEEVDGVPAGHQMHTFNHLDAHINAHIKLLDAHIKPFGQMYQSIES